MALGVLAVLALLAAGALRLGLITTLGYEARTIQTAAVPVASTTFGTGIGLKTMVYFAGQEVTVDYDADVRRGGLIIRLYSVTRPMGGDRDHRHRVVSSGRGTATFHIRTTDLYKLVIEGTVLGADRTARGYDVSYSLVWGLG